MSRLQCTRISPAYATGAPSAVHPPQAIGAGRLIQAQSQVATQRLLHQCCLEPQGPRRIIDPHTATCLIRRSGLDEAVKYGPAQVLFPAQSRILAKDPFDNESPQMQ